MSIKTKILPADAVDLIAILNELGVDYLIAGGHAVAFHGYIRYTGDVDILVRPSLQNAQKVDLALDRFGFGAAGIPKEATARPGVAIHLGSEPNAIDIITSLSGVPTDKALANSVPAVVDGMTVRFISIDDLLENKKATGRLKDRLDIQNLRKLGKIQCLPHKQRRGGQK